MSEQNSESSLKNIVYIVSINFNSKHIEQLINQLSQKQIPVRLQKDHDFIDVPLDRRYFVVVDNSQGVAVLGPWFTSLLLFIVGYPKKGRNQKNHYCTKPSQVLDKYKQFNELPEFVKTNFLSSIITQRLMLKSNKSNKSFITKTISVYQHSEEKKKNFLPETQALLNKKYLKKKDQNSKLLLYLSQVDSSYNKWIFKIAASSTKKYITIEGVEDLSLTLAVCRSKQNYLIIKKCQYDQDIKKKAKSLQIILYNQKQTSTEISQPNIIGICTSHKAVINLLRQIGFEAISLKDVDKSIIKYGKLFSKQKNKSNKKLIWHNQQNIKKQCTSIENQSKCSQNQNQYYFKNQKQNSKDNFNSILSSQVSYGGSQAYSIVAQSRRMSAIGNSNKSEKQNFKILDRKRISIQNFMTSHFKIFANSRMNQKIDPATPILKVQNHEVKQQSVAKQSSQQKSSTSSPFKLKILKLKNRYLKPQNYQNQYQNLGSTLSTEKTKVSKNKLFNLNKDQTNSSNFASDYQNVKSFQNNSENQISSRRFSNIQRISKINQYKNKENTQNQQFSKTEPKQLKSSKAKNSIKSQLKPKKQIKIIKKPKQQNQLIILWKDFNFHIQNSINYLKKQQKLKNINTKTFYFANQLKQILDSSGKKIILLLDEVEIEKYLNVLKNFTNLSQILAVYIFQKQYKSQDNFIKNTSEYIKNIDHFSQIIKLVPQNQYTNESLQTATQIITRFFNSGNI